MKIVVFADEVSPSEHVNGLLTILAKSEKLIDCIFISSEPKHKKFHDVRVKGGFRVVRAASTYSVLKIIYDANLVVCMPSKYFLFRILSKLKLLKFVPLYFGPGKVTKAIGFYKHPEGSELKAQKRI